MKKFIPILGLAVAMVACNTQPDKITELTAASTPVLQAPVVNPDTVGLAQYQAWKAQNELAPVAPEVKPVQYAAVSQSSHTAKKTSSAPVRKPKAVSRPAETKTATPQAGSGTEVSNDQRTGVSTGAGESTAKVEEKKGWSKGAKGAVIGAAGGAVAGAVLNKNNRAVGAVIGGVIGAGGGYVIGRQMDKKDGRIELQ
jgi:hypothetical protein